MTEAIGLDYLVDNEKRAFEETMWRRFEMVGRSITLAAGLAICATERTPIWLHTDFREMQGRQICEMDKPRTLPLKPTDGLEAAILKRTFGPAHPMSGKVGSLLRCVAADEWYAYVMGPRDPDEPCHMWFVGGYRPEFTSDVDHMLGLLSDKKGRQIIEGRTLTHPSLTGRPQLGGYQELNSRSDEAVERRAEKEWRYYYHKQSDGGASRGEDRRIVGKTPLVIASAILNHHKAKAHNQAIAAQITTATDETRTLAA